MNLVSSFPWGLCACCLSSLAMAQGALENPQPEAFESGIGIISGWHCAGPKIEIEFLTPTNFPGGKTLFDAAYGTFRGDTEAICGDTNNGFAMLINFNNLNQGTNTLRALAGGVEFARASFSVATFGQSFLSDASSAVEAILVRDIEQGGNIYAARLQWQQSKQNFSIAETGSSIVNIATLLGAISGNWSGTWQSVNKSGTLSMTLFPTEQAGIGISNLNMNGTGCAATGTTASEIQYLSIPRTQVNMTDGSLLSIVFSPTANGTMFGGTFNFQSGACAGLQGVVALKKG